MHLEAAPRGKVLPTEHAGEGLPGVGVSVEDVHLEVSFLTWRDVGAVRAVPPAEGLHHHHVGQAVLVPSSKPVHLVRQPTCIGGPLELESGRRAAAPP